MFSKVNESQMNIWKKNLLEKKAEQDAKEAQIKKRIESGEMYNNMVNETVGFITTRITEDTKSSYKLHDVKEGIVIIPIYSALVINPELRLYSGTLRTTTNSKTGKLYLSDFYQFKDEEQIKQFFEDVKSQLPAEVRFIEREADASDLAVKGSRVYDVKVEINLND